MPRSTSSDVRRLRKGVDDTVRALRATGRLEAADSLLIALARTCAGKADNPGEPESRQYLKLLVAIEQRLREVGGPADDEFAQLMAAVAWPVTGQ